MSLHMRREANAAAIARLARESDALRNNPSSSPDEKGRTESRRDASVFLNEKREILGSPNIRRIGTLPECLGEVATEMYS